MDKNSNNHTEAFLAKVLKDMNAGINVEEITSNILNAERETAEFRIHTLVEIAIEHARFCRRDTRSE
jgi:hypothetical protein